MSETVSSAATRAIVSRSLLAALASTAVAAGGRVADLRRDAWGHGVLAVARAVRAAGASAALVDDESDVDALAAVGVSGTTSGVADIDPRVLYGLDEDGGAGTRPALRLTGRVLSTKPLRTGEAVSYGYTYRAAHDTRVALVTGGYAQGIVRALGNRARVEIDGVLRPIVGRVAMDVCVVDLEGSDAGVGTEAVFFGGPGPAAGELRTWAAVTGMTPAELLTVAARHAVREEEE